MLMRRGIKMIKTHYRQTIANMDAICECSEETKGNQDYAYVTLLKEYSQYAEHDSDPSREWRTNSKMWCREMTFLIPRFFTSTDESKAGTIIHELSHVLSDARDDTTKGGAESIVNAVSYEYIGDMDSGSAYLQTLSSFLVQFKYVPKP